ncbi:hypothetical protein Celal_3289 [Cellulophaga algicola DSM 14237]|uniref:Uncharacterized protein n=1 Tax=Cellulophaga algicola (strain DSM 14237 / IC166 / ACAM 630) TaxID=688270 RepID=E6X5K0_CELAD|nr:hypothetical protein [Cellulophaga algicola]ADV50555.1 hypothetical protein Celal_3289 [Cellulophaga algicola DSM 14237]
MKKKLVDIFLKKSEMTATASVNGETHDLSMSIGGDNSHEEPMKPFKEQQYYYFCHVIDKVVNGEKYALTVVSKFDMKRYFEFLNPRDNDTMYRLVDISSVGLDGNGTIICGWHNRLTIDEVKMIGGGIIDDALNTRIYFEHKTKSDETYNAKPQNLDNIICDNLLVCEKNVTIDLGSDFSEHINEIAKFTREKDTTYPFARINEKIAKFDNSRTAIGILSNFIPVSKTYKLATTTINFIAEVIGGSSLVLPATDLYDLRGPVKISAVTTDIYESDIGQNSKRYYYKKEKQSNKKSDNVKIYY